MSKSANLAFLNDYLSSLKKNETIYLINVKSDLLKIFNKEIPIHILKSYFIEKGYKNIELKEMKKNNLNDVLEEKSEKVKQKNKIDDDDDDFDPNAFIRQNRERIQQTAIETSSFKDNSWMIQKYQRERNVEVLNELLINNKGLVESIASRYMKHSKNKLDYDDLVSEGFLGLLKAIEKFDVSMGNQFSTYATWWVRQSITRAIIDKGYTIRIPVHMYESINKVLKFERESILTFNEVDIKWVVEQLNITEEKYHEIKKIDFMFLHLASLDIIVSEEDNETSLMDFIEYKPLMGLGSESEIFTNPEVLMINKEIRLFIENWMDILTDREREVLKYRFGWYGNEIKTLEQIGVIYNVTRERIRQIEEKAIRKLRNHMIWKKIDFESIKTIEY